MKSEKEQGWLERLYHLLDISRDVLSFGLRAILSALFTITIISLSFAILAFVFNQLAIPSLFTLWKGASPPTLDLSAFDPPRDVPTKHGIQGYAQVDLQRYTEGLRNVGETINDVQKIASQNNGLAGNLSREIDHMDVIRRIIRQSDLPEPGEIISATNKLEANTTDMISMLRDFLPEARNCGYLLQLRLPHIMKGLEIIGRNRTRYHFWTRTLRYDTTREMGNLKRKSNHFHFWTRILGLGYDGTREMAEVVQEFYSLLESTIERITQLREGAQKLLDHLKLVKESTQALQDMAGSNRIKINQEKINKRLQFLGSFRHRADMEHMKECLDQLDDLDNLVTLSLQVFRKLHDAIEKIKSELATTKIETEKFHLNSTSLSEFTKIIALGT
ncbi:hypothetical protein PG985_013510 [Apiospora marii]|uniref:Uncharacterized protein n=1 Tax=Apiospora marii TaxID=335849 RepID=A0ABR1R7L3_9PEZI